MPENSRFNLCLENRDSGRKDVLEQAENRLRSGPKGDLSARLGILIQRRRASERPTLSSMPDEGLSQVRLGESSRIDAALDHYGEPGVAAFQRTLSSGRSPLAGIREFFRMLAADACEPEAKRSCFLVNRVLEIARSNPQVQERVNHHPDDLRAQTGNRARTNSVRPPSRIGARRRRSAPNVPDIEGTYAAWRDWHCPCQVARQAKTLSRWRATIHERKKERRRTAFLKLDTFGSILLGEGYQTYHLLFG